MDRWQVGFGAAGSNYSITQSTDAPDNFKYSMKWQRTASNAVTNSIWFSQAFESINSKVVAGKTCTLSYYAKKGADYSASSSDIQVRIISGTGTDQSATSAITAGWTGYATPLSTTQVITTGWVRYTHTVTFASNVNQISVNLASNSAGTAGADDSLYITGVQLEVGDTATPFEHRSYGDELARCQRYLKLGGAGVYGIYNSAANIEISIPLNPNMRAAPTLSMAKTTVTISNKTNSNTATATSVSAVNISSSPSGVYFAQIGNCNVTSASAGHIAQFRTDEFLQLDAEL
jgi:hypothetical protein